MPESNPVWMAAAWVVENVEHPEHLLLLAAGLAALGGFWVAARIAQVKARDDVPAGDDLV